MEPPKTHRCRKFDPIINEYEDYLVKFEDDEPPERIIEETSK